MKPSREELMAWRAAHWDGPFNEAKDRMCDALLAVTEERTPPGRWIQVGKDTPGPDIDGRMWFIFERLDDGDCNVCGEYYYHFEGWATDTAVLAWWSEPMVPPAMPSSSGPSA